MATVLTIHRGGADPAEIARLEDEATKAMRALADAMPPSHRWYRVYHHVAAILQLDQNQRKLDAVFAQRKLLPPWEHTKDGA
jgi:predicted metal-dependent HD superfamily phosphohydrolase